MTQVIPCAPLTQCDLSTAANSTVHHVAVSGSGDEEEVAEKKGETWSQSGGGGRGGLYMDDFLDFDAPFNCRLSLKDFDTLIHDLDRELAKQINICL